MSTGCPTWWYSVVVHQLPRLPQVPELPVVGKDALQQARFVTSAPALTAPPPPHIEGPECGTIRVRLCLQKTCALPPRSQRPPAAAANLKLQDGDLQWARKWAHSVQAFIIRSITVRSGIAATMLSRMQQIASSGGVLQTARWQPAVCAHRRGVNHYEPEVQVHELPHVCCINVLMLTRDDSIPLRLQRPPAAAADLKLQDGDLQYAHSDRASKAAQTGSASA